MVDEKCIENDFEKLSFKLDGKYLNYLNNYI